MCTTTTLALIHTPQPQTTNQNKEAETNQRDNSRRDVPELQLAMPGAFSDTHHENFTKAPPKAALHQQQTPSYLGNSQSAGKIFSGILKEVLNILGRVLPWFIWPAVWLVILLVFFFVLSKLSLFVQTSMKPLCILPGLSNSPFCQQSFQPVTTNLTPEALKRTDYSTLVDMQSQTFDRLLEDATGGSALSLGVKKAQLATTDLAIRVRMSDLTAKDALAAALDEFSLEAVKTGRGLQRWTAKVGGSMDSVMAMNSYALMAIENARQIEPSPWSLYAIVPWRSRKSLHDVIKQTFHEAMDVLSINMERLIVEAENSHANLIKLEEKLDLIHQIATREGLNISAERSELLEQLWTKIGGNRRSIKTFDRHLAILRLLTLYRKQALVHVVGALETLHAMSSEMEDMRERVAASELLRSHVPAEVHMMSIQAGLSRLREGRIEAKRQEQSAVGRMMSFDE